MIIALLVITSALSIDPVESKSEASQYQSMLMKQCIECNFQDSSRTTRRLWQLLTHAEPNYDPCTWGHSVVSTDGILKTFVFIRMPKQYVYSPWKIEMDWLPSSLAFVHLSDIDMVSVWLAERLPRDLRYLSYGSSGMKFIAKNRRVDLTHLPERMEELLVRNGWFSGAVNLMHLPRTMRLLILRHVTVHKAFLRHSQLPDGLVQIFLYDGAAGTQLQEVDGAGVDARVSNEGSTWKHPTTNYFELSIYREGLVQQALVIREDFKALFPPRLPLQDLVLA